MDYKDVIFMILGIIGIVIAIPGFIINLKQKEHRKDYIFTGIGLILISIGFFAYSHNWIIKKEGSETVLQDTTRTKLPPKDPIDSSAITMPQASTIKTDVSVVKDTPEDTTAIAVVMPEDKKEAILKMNKPIQTRAEFSNIRGQVKIAVVGCQVIGDEVLVKLKYENIGPKEIIRHFTSRTGAKIFDQDGNMHILVHNSIANEVAERSAINYELVIGVPVNGEMRFSIGNYQVTKLNMIKFTNSGHQITNVPIF